MALSVLKSLMFFSVVLMSVISTNGQFSINIDGIEQVTSLLENVTGTSASMSSILSHVRNLLTNQQDLQILNNRLIVNQSATADEMVNLLQQVQGMLQHKLEKEQWNHVEKIDLLQNQLGKLGQIVDLVMLGQLSSKSDACKHANETITELPKKCDDTTEQMAETQGQISQTVTKMAETQTQLGVIQIQSLDIQSNTLNAMTEMASTLAEIQQTHEESKATLKKEQTTLAQALLIQNDTLKAVSRMETTVSNALTQITTAQTNTLNTLTEIKQAHEESKATQQKEQTTLSQVLTVQNDTLNAVSRMETTMSNASTQIATAQTNTLNTLTEMQQTQSQMAHTFTEVANLLQLQNQHLRSLSTTMNTVVPVLEKQQETLENISDSIPQAHDQQVTQQSTTMITETPTPTPLIRDCSELSSQGGHSSGIYTITPREGMSLDVYCNTEDHDGGWTVFQKRYDGTVDFYRNWDNYTQGFGSLDGEFWIGLQAIHLLTNTPGTIWQLLILLQDFDNETAYANYQHFSVGDASSHYRLTIGTYSGTAGDSMAGSYSLNNQPFSTHERDNDARSSYNCANHHQGAWWYKFCSNANLNGQYLGPTGNRWDGMTWYHWKYSVQSLKSSTMMMRPVR